MSLDLKNIPDGPKAFLTQLLDEKLGFTVERAKAFLAESRAEAPTDGETDFRGDAIGKLEHFLRVKRHWQAAVDVAWPFLQPFAAAVVDEALAEEGSP